MKWGLKADDGPISIRLRTQNSFLFDVIGFWGFIMGLETQLRFPKREKRKLWADDDIQVHVKLGICAIYKFY